MEELLHHSSAKEKMPQCSLSLTCNEDLWEAGSVAPEDPANWTTITAVCIPVTHWCEGCYSLYNTQVPFAPGEPGKHCESHVLWLLQCFSNTIQLCFNSCSCHLQKFSNSSFAGCINKDKEEEYSGLTEKFVTWCNNNHLKLNISNTKNWWWTTRGAGGPCYHQGRGSGEDGLIQVPWNPNQQKTGLVSQHRLPLQREQSGLFFLRILRYFSVCNRLLQMFYQSVHSSQCTVLCWAGTGPPGVIEIEQDEGQNQSNPRKCLSQPLQWAVVDEQLIQPPDYPS